VATADVGETDFHGVAVGEGHAEAEELQTEKEY